MMEVFPGLHQSTMYIEPLDFTIHRYLLASDPAVLFATGTHDEAVRDLPEVERILGGRDLRYIVVSHMESDECGGLQVYLDRYPDVTVLCSRLAARELPGFGYRGRIEPVFSGRAIEDGGVLLRFADYPSEVHLQDGIVCLEERSGVLYSSDLFQTMGDGRGKVSRASWYRTARDVHEDRVSERRMEALREQLLDMDPAFVAVGHGTCIGLR